MMHLQTKEHQRLWASLRSRRQHGTDSPSQPWRNQPALDLRLVPPELRNNWFLLFKPARLRFFTMTAPGNKLRWINWLPLWVMGLIFAESYQFPGSLIIWQGREPFCVGRTRLSVPSRKSAQLQLQHNEETYCAHKQRAANLISRIRTFRDEGITRSSSCLSTDRKETALYHDWVSLSPNKSLTNTCTLFLLFCFKGWCQPNTLIS